MTIECAFSGRLGKPPQRRLTTAGDPWLALTVAVGSGDEVEWVAVSIFGRLVDELPDDIEVGGKVYVEGKLQLKRWTSNTGPRAGLQVNATRVLVLDRIGRRRKSGRRSSASAAGNTSAGVQSQKSAPGEFA